ncbi:phosphoheptose isomerase [Rhizobium etli bv. mimosae str. IE4771]|uniref:Phosphoheptose isomerase n=1 Tax=Rhizobium etli bv. mimosae str. IE4771 TaxID=1432050 RepID=A0A060I7A1_RHIET|nr:SIS domain-containing protein [Rhizobium sp. IE4771]AIC27436.1 phosphoheptose isomerase [Rhizobium sp. IE4771]
MNPNTYVSAVQNALTQTDITALDNVVEIFKTAFWKHRQIFVFGNGASAALASHMATDAGKLLIVDNGAGGRTRLRIQSLNDNCAWLTAIGNDIGYDDVFTEQLANYLRPEDVVVGISGSGGSPNVLRALEFAKSRGATLVGFTSARSSAEKMAGLCDVCLRAPLEMMEQIEDLHVIYHHIIVRGVYDAITRQEVVKTGAEAPS